MKKIIRITAVVIMMTLCITSIQPVVANAGTKKVTTTKKKIKLIKKKATMIVKQKLQLKLKNAKAKKVKWSSSNKKVATVKKGLVKAKKKGKATITAKYKGKKNHCKKKFFGKNANRSAGLSLRNARTDPGG